MKKLHDYLRTFIQIIFLTFLVLGGFVPEWKPTATLFLGLYGNFYTVALTISLAVYFLYIFGLAIAGQSSKEDFLALGSVYILFSITMLMTSSSLMTPADIRIRMLKFIAVFAIITFSVERPNWPHRIIRKIVKN